MSNENNEAKREMREKIEDATNRFHDAREWWDDYYADENGKTVGDRLLDDCIEIVCRRLGVRLTDAEPSREGPPGDGWRFLRHDEIVLDSDEFLDTSAMSFGWKPTRDAGEKAGAGIFYRRRTDTSPPASSVTLTAAEREAIIRGQEALEYVGADPHCPCFETQTLKWAATLRGLLERLG